MKLAAIIATFSSELVYTILMIMTWIMLLGWSAALISACVLAFRNRKEDDREEPPTSSLDAPIPSAKTHPFGHSYWL